MLRVRGSGTGGRLDLDSQEVRAPFHDQIDLLARRRSPIEEFGTLGHDRVAPDEKVGEHEILEVRTGRNAQAGDVQSDDDLARLKARLDALPGGGAPSRQCFRKFVRSFGA